MQRQKWIFLLASAAGIVLLVPGPARTNPPVSQNSFDALYHPPQEVAAILHRACYDCHSNQTQWPWYSLAGPGAWLVTRDVQKGRSVMNFSDWTQGGVRKPDAVTAALLLAASNGIKSGRMPKAPYPIMHAKARLTPEEKNLIIRWASSEARVLFAHRSKP